jgi:hypothetical protein
VPHRSAITDEKQLGALLRAVDECTAWPTLKATLKFPRAHDDDATRRRLRRNEVDWLSGTSRIADERMKMRRPHEVPLSRQVLAVLRDLWPLTQGDNLVFPSARSVGP